MMFLNPIKSYLTKIEAYIQSKDHKSMLKQILDENDKENIKSDAIQQFHSVCTKLSSKKSFDTENVSKFDESNMSEISVEDEMDCSTFVQNEDVPKKELIFENSVEYVCIVENNGSDVLKPKSTVFLKVQTVPNRVFVKTGLGKNHTSKLTSLVHDDYADGFG